MQRRRSSQLPVRLSASEDVPEIVVTNPSSSARKSRSKIPRPESAITARAVSAEPKKRNSGGKLSLLKRSKSNLDRAVANKNLLETPKTSRNRLSKNPASSSVVKNYDSQYAKLTNDKQWQQSTSLKVQNFIQDLTNGQELQSGLRPLTRNIFVTICNLLFSKINSKLKITMNNYVEELPVIMEMLEYPIPLKKSLLTAVNIPRNFGAVLALFDWLITFIQTNELFNVEAAVKDQDSHWDRITQAYIGWLQDERLDKFKDEFIELMMKEEDLVNAISNLKDTLKEKETEIQTLTEQEDALESELQPYREIAEKIKLCETEIKKLEQSKSDIEANIKLREGTLATLNHMHDNLFKEREQLQSKVNLQNGKKEQYLWLVNECSNLEQQIQSIEAMIDHRETLIYNETPKLEQLKNQVIQLSNEYNNKCLDNEALKEFTVCNLSDTNDVINVLKSFKTKIENYLEEKNQEVKNIKKKITESKCKIFDFEQKYKCFESEKQKLNQLIEEVESLKKRYQDAYQLNLNQTEKANKLKEDIAEIDNEMNEIKKKEQFLIEETAKTIEKINKQDIEFVKEMNERFAELERELQQRLTATETVLEAVKKI